MVNHEGAARFQAVYEETSPNGTVRAITLGIGMHLGSVAAHAFAQRMTHHCGWKVRDIQLHPQQPLR